MRGAGAILLSVFVFVVAAAQPAMNGCSGETEYTTLVNLFIGTGGHGHTYPGASLPFGMVQLGPDTRLEGWDGCSGYHYSDTIVYGFSHTHLSGTGVPDYCDILFMPTVGEVQLQRGDGINTESGYHSRFRHENESASPGYYSVLLDDYGVGVELTVTRRAGFHRYTFPGSGSANIVIDLEHRDPVIDAGVRIVGKSEIEGYRISDSWADDQHVYFVARFSKPFDTYGITVDDETFEAPAPGGAGSGDWKQRPGGEVQPPEGGITEARGKNVKAYVGFRTMEGERVLVKVGISAVSVEGARRNLDAEIAGWDFDRVREGANAEWNRTLGRIRVHGGTREQTVVFYTALYHALLNPNLFMDVDGRYRGMDHAVHEAEGFENYTVFSLWDTYRAEHPLLTIIEPERTKDFVNTFMSQYETGGLLPVWELAGNETWCMIGYHSVSVIADAYIKGIRGFDIEKAFEAMKHSAVQDHHGLSHYKKLGYIPADGDGESVSKTLEYAYDDWCIARVAKELGRDGDYKRFIRRAQSYKNLFDPSTGFMRARMNGAWYEPFDPAEVNYNYTEANSWQYSFYVPQDVRGLIDLMGGREGFVKKLDGLFDADSRTAGWRQPDITGLVGQYAHGNEPSHHMAYLYAYVGEPWKTQEKVRAIMDGLYTAAPDGLCGNEDCGQMSAWYVLSALGFYPVTPGSDVYVIGTPLFERAELDVSGGREFVIRADGVSGKNIYIQSASLNGEPYSRSWLRHRDIMGGGELVFEMGSVPCMSWGSGDSDIPYSAIEDNPILPAPYAVPGKRAFTDSVEVSLTSPTGGARIFYTTDGREPTLDSRWYAGPLKLKESAVIKAFAFKEGMPPSSVVTAEFKRVPAGRSIELNTPYSPMYSAGGDLALIDLVRGAENFRTGTWQGYEGVDLDAVVDLGCSRNIRCISAGFLQDQGSWIFLPLEVEYAVSDDGSRFEVVATLTHEIPRDREGCIIHDFEKRGLDIEARYVRVQARNIGVCPSWHRGAGGKAWLFADEIIVE